MPSSEVYSYRPTSCLILFLKFSLEAPDGKALFLAIQIEVVFGSPEALLRGSLRLEKVGRNTSLISLDFLSVAPKTPL